MREDAHWGFKRKEGKKKNGEKRQNFYDLITAYIFIFFVPLSSRTVAIC